MESKGPSRTRRLLLFCTVAIAFICWGLLLSLQPAFYPTEAQSKGATPSQVKQLQSFKMTVLVFFVSQYGFVFGIVSLAAVIFSPIFAHFGNLIGPKLLYILGAYTQASNSQPDLLLVKTLHLQVYRLSVPLVLVFQNLSTIHLYLLVSLTSLGTVLSLLCKVITQFLILTILHSNMEINIFSPADFQKEQHQLLAYVA